MLEEGVSDVVISLHSIAKSVFSGLLQGLVVLALCGIADVQAAKDEDKDPIVFFPQSDVNFGHVVKPSSTVTITVASTGGYTTTGAPIILGSSSISPGKMKVTGKKNAKVDVEFVKQCSVQGLDISVDVPYDNQVYHFGQVFEARFDGNSQFTLEYGATMTISPGVSTGEQTACGYNIVVEYQ